MELIILIAIIAVGYCVIKTLKINSENNRKSLIEASPDYQSKIRAIRDMIKYQNEHISLTEHIHENKAELGVCKDVGKRKELLVKIDEYNRERKSLARNFHKKYENDPYDPKMIPLSQFPAELLEQWEDVESRLDAIVRSKS